MRETLKQATGVTRGKNALSVFNLEFPNHCDEFTISGYRFKRVPNYSTAVRQIGRIVTIDYEFKLETTAGTNTVTAIVETPFKEENAVLSWQTERTTLADIELLLSLTTHREILTLPHEEAKKASLIFADARQYPGGWTLRSSMPYIASLRQSPFDDFYDIGFEHGLNAMHNLIKSHAWQTKYQGGYVLSLAKDAFVYQKLTKAFLQSFSLWEHLYRVHNPLSLGEAKLRNKKGSECLGFLLHHYRFLPSDDDSTRRALQRAFVNTRNELSHNGQWPASEESMKDAKTFVELTARLVTEILGLKAKDVLCSQRKLTDILKRS